MSATTHSASADSRASYVPLLLSITLAGTAMAAVIVWQVTGLSILGLLIGPWLLVVVVMTPRGWRVDCDGETGVASDRRLVMAGGLSRVLLVAGLATATGTNEPRTTTGDTAASAGERLAPARLASGGTAR